MQIQRQTDTDTDTDTDMYAVTGHWRLRAR